MKSKSRPQPGSGPANTTGTKPSISGRHSGGSSHSSLGLLSDLRLLGGWRARDEMDEGQTLTGAVLRLPTPNAFNGNRLFLNTEDGVVGLRATARSGHTVLERELESLRVRVGDRISILYLGKRPTFDGKREYRLYEVGLL